MYLRKRLWGENERVKKKQKSFLFRIFDFSVVFLFSVFFSFLSASLKLEMERKPKSKTKIATENDDVCVQYLPLAAEREEEAGEDEERLVKTINLCRLEVPENEDSL